MPIFTRTNNPRFSSSCDKNWKQYEAKQLQGSISAYDAKKDGIKFFLEELYTFSSR